MADQLTAEFSIIEYLATEDKNELIRQIGSEIEAILTNWRGVPDNLIDRLPNLKIISSYGVGYDSIDAKAAAHKNIFVTNTPGVLNDEVADTAIMLWLSVYRQLIEADRWVRSGDWARIGAFPLTKTVQRKKVGILGLGRIGLTLAKRLSAFNAEIYYHSRKKKNVDYHYEKTVENLAEQVEVLFICTPGGSNTENLVDKKVLKALGPSGTLINVSRGSVVNELVLIEMLKKREIAAAGLDVFEAEPNISSEFKLLKNVVLTPHIGSATFETRQAMGNLTCQNLKAFFNHQKVLTPVPECSNLKIL